ncbi:hypothetical protein DJ568_12450 [Mucilaginibacter hurinus]|uniref:Uncharacterized protein n=1 Tax=Mucilaginibacter hurinus TaxID=2201324 RepID=A0A367GPJ9_9SPHI|nr:polysaccharide biosynthesis C-terminal domain-containing protein [Mucilaginibacter hurinus]RCH54623.1 hypothetical protein DJ568_12450 [Mucilaginibacter hurinus]
MGIVKKQAYKNTLISYLGMGIGYINTVLLIPAFLTTQQFGFYILLGSLAIMYSLIASLGVPGIIAKYFPVYRTDDGKHNGFMHWTALLAVVGFVLCTVLFIALRPVILSAFIENGSLLTRYYYYLIPLAFFLIMFNYLEMTGRVLYKNIFSNFLFEVVQRLLTTLLLVLLGLKWIGYQEFIVYYIAINGFISFALLIHLALLKQFTYKINDLKFSGIKKREVANYGLYAVTSSAVYVLLQKIDGIMLSSMAGDATQGVYSWYFAIAAVISVPGKALSRTTYAIVANAWKAKDMANIDEVYTKTSMIQMVAGLLLFVGIIINRDNLYALARNPDYTDPKYFSLFIVIGLGFMVDITGGLNTYIISVSHKYRLLTYFVIINSTFCVIMNYILIPKMGGLGAAIAYSVTIFIFNFGNWFYIKYRFKMQPFSYKNLLVILVAVISYFIGAYIWRLPNVFADIIVRSSITALVYVSLTYYLKISEDVNEKIDSILKKIRPQRLG